MIIVSPAELRANLKKYLDLAATNEIVIQRGKTEIFTLRRHQSDDDADLIVSMDENLLKKFENYLDELHERATRSESRKFQTTSYIL